jgi:hypothetical protein
MLVPTGLPLPILPSSLLLSPVSGNHHSCLNFYEVTLHTAYTGETMWHFSVYGWLILLSDL